MSGGVKLVRFKGAKYWNDATVEMMSDGERAGEKWVRHRPSYRSDCLNRFLEKLDGRASTVDRARFPRDIGSPRVKNPPPCAKQWMLSITTVEVVLNCIYMFSSSESSP